MRSVCARTASVFAVVCSTAVPAALGAFVIDDRSFFDGIGHTLIDFETRADGSAISLEFLETLPMPPDEYGAIGVRFLTTARLEYFKTASPSARDALRLGGSLDLYLPFGSLTPDTPFEILFDTPVRAAGFFALTDDDLPGPEFDVFGATGELLGSFGLVGELVDGVVAESVVFGYIGFAADEPIARIALSNGAIGWGIDDLRFSSVPGPGGTGLLVVAVAVSATRRRRHNIPV